MGERVLVTGANGCLGAWVVRQLIDAGDEAVIFDIGADDHRHRLVSRGAELDFERIIGDICDRDAVVSAAAGVDRLIHLAALQVPFCRDNPSLGAAVNVVGTVNVFEAALEHGIAPVVYASSIAVYGSPDDYDQPRLAADAPARPRTLYGAYKVANEQTAAVYAADHGLSSVGLRPHTIYGPGRDQGLTSQPTVAIEHAVRRQPYSVEYGGVLDFQFAPDVARLFVAAARSRPDGAPVLNVAGHVVPVAEFVALAGDIAGYDGLGVGTGSLPLPHTAAPDGLAELLGDITPTSPTSVEDAIRETCEIFAAAIPTGGERWEQ